MKEYKILCMHHELNLEFFVFHKKWEGQEKVEVQELKELQVEKRHELQLSSYALFKKTF